MSCCQLLPLRFDYLGTRLGLALVIFYEALECLSNLCLIAADLSQRV